MRRKGELSRGRIDRDWPHQIVLKANDCRGQQYELIHKFCEGLSLCPRGHSFVENDEWMRVFCFAEKGGRREISGGVRRGRFDPARKRSGPGWSKLKEPKQKYY